MDWSKVIELANEYVEEIESGTSNSDRLSKYDHAIMEAALEAVHGPNIWDRINPILMEM